MKILIKERFSRVWTVREIILSSLTVFVTFSTTTPAFTQPSHSVTDQPSVNLEFSEPILLSDQNRKQDGVMFGGWGPHLRSILRMNDDSLWYVMDHSKGDVSSNDQLWYFHQYSGKWKKRAHQDLIAGANQGFAHIASGTDIYSYGVNFRLAQLHECSIRPETLVRRECTVVRNPSGKAIRIGGGANYVGAAISPKGTRLVWWVVVTQDGTQQWRYVYNRGDGWQGPVITHLAPSRGGLSYIYVRFANENEVVLSGQIWSGTFPEGSPQAILTCFRIGSPIEGFHTLKSSDEKGFPKSGSDLWVHPETATVHAVVEGFGNDFFGDKVHYYTFNLRDPWRELTPVETFFGYFRARFAQIDSGDLFLVLGGQSGSSKIDVLHVPESDLTEPIKWNAANRFSPAMPGKRHYAPMAIWIENRAYQTTPVRNLNFAITGENPERDHEVWFYTATLR